MTGGAASTDVFAAIARVVAGASHAMVTVRAKDCALRVHLRDDGVGGARPVGTGLLGLEHRLAALDRQARHHREHHRRLR